MVGPGRLPKAPSGAEQRLLHVHGAHPAALSSVPGNVLKWHGTHGNLVHMVKGCQWINLLGHSVDAIPSFPRSPNCCTNGASHG